MVMNEDTAEVLASIVPFELTSAQRRVLDEITKDMTGKEPMNRLLQGDVGSGKTIVALEAMILAVENGFQAALMAPTGFLRSSTPAISEICFDRQNAGSDCSPEVFEPARSAKCRSGSRLETSIS